jgi:hypothetical protein
MGMQNFDEEEPSGRRLASIPFHNKTPAEVDKPIREGFVRTGEA